MTETCQKHQPGSALGGPVRGGAPGRSLLTSSGDNLQDAQMLPGVRRPTSLDVSYVSVPANQANSFSSTITVKTLQVSRCDNNVGVFVSDQDTRLSLIATDQSYRQNFTAADDSRSTKLGTIHSIIDMIVRVSFGDRRKKVLYLTK